MAEKSCVLMIVVGMTAHVHCFVAGYFPLAASVYCAAGVGHTMIKLIMRLLIYPGDL
ncbi:MULTISPECIES: hypothetical protein [unclassified Erwinia]|uniref:hypothetical protein n=1 Tax=unclassified Erwinia TaxID=2622719 RepID=UPI00130463BC|nr:MULTISPECIES: hypothetical protein [unclassified Erwinia]